ncbi:MAG: MarR family transcriptional regulator [Eubacteriales bacterium]|nr:MarR family transcriptional regulator [Eubacteriales bacterium]
MKAQKISERFVQNLLLAMPNWNSRLVRPFRESLNREMSLETYYCLETLKMCGVVTMSELAAQLKVPKQQVTKLIDKLCVHGFVERVYNKEDRRSIWIRLTPDAIKYLDEYYLKNKAFIQMLEERLTEEELQKLNGAVEVLGELLPKLK